MMSKKFLSPIILFALMLLAGAIVAYGGPATGSKAKPKSLEKVATNDLYRTMLINNIFDYYSNNGDMSFNPFSTDNEGFEFAKGSNGHVFFEQGLVWTGYNALYDATAGALSPVTLKCSGSTYNHALQAGPILTAGTLTSAPVAANPGDAQYRVFRVRTDVTPADWAGVLPSGKGASSQSDALALITAEELPFITRYEAFSANQLYQQYLADWNNWPAAQGAPFTYGKDAQGNQRQAPAPYDPHFDIPGQPGADMTLWYVSNDLDVTRVTHFYGSTEGTGIEQQTTIWAYKRASNTALGNTIFSGFKLINKSGMPIDTMYISVWADPDLGGSIGATDNFSGCDTTRSLGFIWNGTACNPDPVYGCSPPAGGQVFFQGPIIPSPGDSAIFNLQYRHDFKNLKLTAYNFFINGSTTYADPDLNNPDGTLQWYHLMQGLIGNSGVPYIDPTSGLPTKFLLWGDPVTGQGWIEGGQYAIAPPGDRRQCLITGPFVMGAGDTQQVVVGTLAGRGSDKVSSVAVLRWYTDQAQAAYNVLFDLPTPPPSPTVKVVNLDGEVVLDWSGDTAHVGLTERSDSKGFKFQGYNVYQLPGSSSANAKLLATYDLVDLVLKIQDYVFDAGTGTVILKPVQFGNDAGVQRFYDAKTDAFSTYGNLLANGQNYYYAVTSYNYNSQHGLTPNNLESSILVLKATPVGPIPGTRYLSTTGQTVPVTHTKGIASTTTQVKVVDPSAVKPSDYEIRVVVNDSVFNNDLQVNVANPKWTLYDVTNSKQLTALSTYYSIDNSNPVVNGIQVGFSATPFYKYGSELGASIWTGPSPYNFARVNPGSPGDLTTLSGRLGIYVGNDFFGDGLLNPSDVVTSVEFDFVPKGQGQNAYDFVRTTTGSTGAPFYGFFPQPFTVWELNADGSHRRQLDFVFMEAGASTFFDSVWAPGLLSSDREYWFVIAETYTATPKAKYTGATLGGAISADSAVWSGWMTLAPGATIPYEPGDKWQLIATKILTAADVHAFSTKTIAPISSAAGAQADVSKINVYPNPYFGFNPAESNKYQRFITFTHLPNVATIRIFNVAGVLVRTIVKNDHLVTSDQASQYTQWDLKNESGIPAAAGVYIAFIDLPELGKTKTLKFSIIPETQFLDRY